MRFDCISRGQQPYGDTIAWYKVHGAKDLADAKDGFTRQFHITNWSDSGIGGFPFGLDSYCVIRAGKDNTFEVAIVDPYCD